MLRFVVLFTLAFNVAVAQDATTTEGADHAIHQELRGLLSGIETALNEGKYEGIAPFFHKDLRITTITQETITTRDEIATYFNDNFGPGRVLKSMKAKFEADELTKLYGDKTHGVVRGHGSEFYQLNDGREYEMKIRWTATVIKDTDGKWRILTFHSGTDFLDNPILDEAAKGAKYLGAGGLAAGLFIGFLLTWLLLRRKGGIKDTASVESAA